ncbi:MAG: acetyl-CoA carboxylase biotin carboxyl carrier protein subunit, partial [Rudaea sp.]
VVEGRIDTGYLDRHLDEFLPADTTPEATVLFAAATTVLLAEEVYARDAIACADDPHSPWSRADGWRLGHPGKRIVCFEAGTQRIEIAAYGANGRYALRLGDVECAVSDAFWQNHTLTAAFDGVARRWQAHVDTDSVLLHDGERRRHLRRVGAFAYAATPQTASDRIIAPMPGRIVLVKVKNGDRVSEGQELLIMEAMKMELSLKAPHAATIESLHAKPGEFVEADTVLVRFGESQS